MAVLLYTVLTCDVDYRYVVCVVRWKKTQIPIFLG